MTKIKLLIIILLPFIGYSQLPSYNWGGQIGGIGSDSSRTITTDIFGNIIVTGTFNDTVDFNLDISITNNLTSSGNTDSYISKYTSSGDLVWVKSIQSNGLSGINPLITSSITDSSGNIYITGYFEGTIDFNPSSSDNELYTANGDSDIFIIKLDVNGVFVWGGTIGGTQGDRANSITIDDQDNIYLTGYFEETIDFDITDGVLNLTGSSFGSVFVIKLDKNSNLIWGQSFLGGADQGNSIIVDNLYNVYVTGHIRGTTDFDPSPNTFNLSSTGGTRAAFVLKLNNNGDFVNAGVTSSLNSGSIPDANEIKLDSNNNVYVAGSFSGSVDFDFSTGVQDLVSTGSSAFDDIFILKLDNDLNYSWVGKMGSNVNDSALGMVIDNNDNIYTTGYYEGSGVVAADFDPDPSVYNPLSGSSEQEVFVSILDSDGIYIDAENIIGSSDDRARDIAIDNVGNIYIVGEFPFDIRNFPDFDIDSNGSTDGFLFKFGNVTNNDPDNFPPVAIDDNFYVVQGGNQTINIVSNDSDSDGTLLNSSVSIITHPTNGNIVDNGNGTITYNHNGSSMPNDSFQYTIEDNDNATSNVATVNISTTLGLEDLNLSNTIKIYPNPVKSFLLIDALIEISKIEIYSIAGVKVYELESTKKADISNLKSGVYILSINDSIGRKFQKIILKK